VRLPMENFSSVPLNVTCCAGMKSRQIFHLAPGKLSSAALTVNAEARAGGSSSDPRGVSIFFQRGDPEGEIHLPGRVKYALSNCVQSRSMRTMIRSAKNKACQRQTS